MPVSSASHASFASTAASACAALVVFASAIAAPVHAQNAPQGASNQREQLSKNEQNEQNEQPAPGQRTERIALEDAGSRVQELRVGGQTQSITVSPKGADLPAYEVQPTTARQRQHNDGEGQTTGTRVWNVLKF